MVKPLDGGLSKQLSYCRDLAVGKHRTRMQAAHNCRSSPTCLSPHSYLTPTQPHRWTLRRTTPRQTTPRDATPRDATRRDTTPRHYTRTHRTSHHHAAPHNSIRHIIQEHSTPVRLEVDCAEGVHSLLALRKLGGWPVELNRIKRRCLGEKGSDQGTDVPQMCIHSLATRDRDPVGWVGSGMVR